jgi:hypothetical protein
VFFPTEPQSHPGTAGLSSACAVGAFGTVDNMNVIRENKTANTNTATGNGLGQIGATVNSWPFIQLYDLNPTGSVVINYNKGGGTQSTTLTFDTVDQFANLESDRTVFPTGAQVHLTLTDVQLNIDPTDEDSWTFGTLASNSTVVYQAFNENGDREADGTDGAKDLASVLGSADFMFEDNGILKINLDAQGTGTEVLRIVDNGDSVTNGTSTSLASKVRTGNSTYTGSFLGGSQPVTFTELSSNSGLFANYDESDKSNIIISTDANRGVSASVDYNETPKTVLVGFGFGNIDIQATDDEWNSGEEIPVVLVDTDANQNSRVDEDLDLFNPDVPLIPSLATGDPFTLGETATGTGSIEDVVFMTVAPTFAVHDFGVGSVEVDGMTKVNFAATTNASATIKVDKFSQRAILTSNNTVTGSFQALVIDLDVKAEELFSSISNPQGTGIDNRLHGFNLFNQDMRSLNATGVYNVYLLNGTEIITDNSNKGLQVVNDVTAISIANGTNAQSLSIFNQTASMTTAEKNHL